MSALAEAPAPPPAGAGRSPQEEAWWFAEAEAVAVMGTVNVAVARLVAAVRGLLDTDGWEGIGIQSPEHWLCWKAGISRPRAEGLVTIARRARELPECWALFESGRLGEDAMVRIARRVPASRDAEVAALAPSLLIAQLDRLLRSLPEQPGGTEPRPEPERMLRLHDGRDGWLRGRFCLPADEGALVRLGLTSARDAEFRDRNDLPDPDPDADTDPDEAAATRTVSWADGLVRMASEAADALDPTYRRTGQRGERNTVVLHIDVDPDGTLGPAQLEWARSCPTRWPGSCPATPRSRSWPTGSANSSASTPPSAPPTAPCAATSPAATKAAPTPCAPNGSGCTPTTSGTGNTAAPPSPTTSCSSAPGTTAPYTSASSRSKATPKPAPSASSTTGANPSRPPGLDPPDPGPPRSGGPPHDGQPPSRYTPPLAERLTADTFTWN